MGYKLENLHSISVSGIPKLCASLSPGNDGVPDRLVCLPGGRVVFVELKAPGALPCPLQIHQMGLLKKLGFRVEVIDAKSQVDALIRALGGKDV